MKHIFLKETLRLLPSQLLCNQDMLLKKIQSFLERAQLQTVMLLVKKKLKKLLRQVKYYIPLLVQIRPMQRLQLKAKIMTM